jgi:hemoglobin
MYPEGDWAGAEVRLADFLLFRIGGVPKYIEERGHPRLRMRHLPFRIGVAERDRWVELMEGAMVETEVPGDAAAFLTPFFAQVADFMRNQAGE